VTLGEAMLRLSTQSQAQIVGAQALDIHVGGSESNVAAALASLGTPSAWVSCLPDTPLGRRVVRPIAATGVDVSPTRFVQSGRVGLYFVEMGSPPRPSAVWYDRADSAFSHAVQVEPSVLDGARAAVVSGITPALSQRAQSAAFRFTDAARQRGVAVVVDVNYRSRLWEPSAARPVLTDLVGQADIAICGAADAHTVFGLDGSDEDLAIAFAREQAPSARLVVLTCGDRGSVAVSDEGVTSRPAIPLQIVDRFGAGDAFVAGLLHVVLGGGTTADALVFGSALAALACTVPGDIAAFTSDDVQAVLEGHTLRR
jgi:2-dehydro-3-deoxygluconokinase